MTNYDDSPYRSVLSSWIFTTPQMILLKNMKYRRVRDNAMIFFSKRFLNRHLLPSTRPQSGAIFNGNALWHYPGSGTF